MKIPPVTAGDSERMNMALAEAGYPNMVYSDLDGMGRVDRDVPLDVVWRGREVIDRQPVMCFACYKAAQPRGDYGDACAATERFTEDCRD